MKKNILIFCILWMGKIAFAQTNTFPSSGNVGIGTTSPIMPLSVESSSANGIKLSRDGVDIGQIDFTSMDLYVRSTTNNLKFSSPTGKVISLLSEKVGIGTANPTMPLSIESSNASGISLFRSGLDVGQIDFSDNNFNVRSNTNNLQFDVPLGKVFIFSTGNVGIGTTSPSEKLAVNGKIRAKEIKVETGWADFVFKPDYKLRSLKETEQFIKQNGHLPEIPSAKNVEENGINLGEMNAKLLQKIEELTLHLIGQNKTQEALINEVKQLKSEINQLKSKP